MIKLRNLLIDLEKVNKIFFGLLKLDGLLNLVVLQIQKVNLFQLVKNH